MALFSNAFESNEWTATGRTERLNNEQVKTIQDCYIKSHTLEDGTVLKNIVLVAVGMRPQSIKLAPEKYQVQYPDNTKIDPTSIVNAEYVDLSGETKWTATCKKK